MHRYADDDEAYDLYMDERYARQQHAKLMRHPDPRDPDYPGDPDATEDNDGEADEL